jgi:CubicO group peptidase (beta-lactamase class C family)
MLTIALLAAALVQGPPRFTDPERRAKLESAFPKLDRIFEEFQRRRNAPGLVYGVVIDGQLAHVRAMGLRNRATGEPVTIDTVFRIASMTKSFTALAVLKLRDEGRLSLDDPVSRWIPEIGKLNYPTRDSPPIRVRDLMTHTAGFPEDNPWGDRQLAIPEATFTQWLRKGIPFSTPPGTAYEYSNYGFALLGRIVERVSGAPYRDYLEKRILAPLGMKNSTLEPSAVPERLRAMGYRLSNGQYSEEPSLAHGAFGAMGGLLTNAPDLARYVAFQLSAFPARDEEDRGPVKRSSLREMQQAWRWNELTVEGADRAVVRGYGYGLAVLRDRRFAHMVGHGGGLPGFGSYMLWLPEYGVGVFAMANVTYAAPFVAAREALNALDATGGLVPRKLSPAPVLTETRDRIFGLWQRWEDGAADEFAADNLYLDRPKAERRSEMEKLKAEVGTCRAGEVNPENALRGSFRLDCENGGVRVTFTLAPTIPPKVQSLSFDRAAR